ncbi:MAG: 50S ribosomal protein L30 [Terriglobia bacterium]
MKTDSKTIYVRWVRSAIGFSDHQKRMVRSLGLHRLNHTVELQDTPSVRGLVAKLSHLVQVVNLDVKPVWSIVPEYVIQPAKTSKIKTQSAREHPSASAGSESPQPTPEEKT